MASLDGRKIEENTIIGTVKTDKTGSECDFEICPVEVWETLTEEEANKLALEALHESGVLQIWW